MKIQSVWGITVDWQAHGSQAVICTPVIWSMVIIAVCVCVCVHAEKCMCLLLWADEWQFKQTHNVVNQKIKKQTKNKKAFSVWPHLLLHLYASMKFHRALFLFYSVLSLGHRLCFSSTFIHTFTASLLHPSRWGRKNAATLHWFWEAVILGLCPTSD